MFVMHDYRESDAGAVPRVLCSPVKGYALVCTYSMHACPFLASLVQSKAACTCWKTGWLHSSDRAVTIMRLLILCCLPFLPWSDALVCITGSASAAHVYSHCLSMFRYEGTGRSLSLKLLAQLREASTPSSAGTGKAGGSAATGRLLREVTLEEPIRYVAT